jgi:hypothetical protein
VRSLVKLEVAAERYSQLWLKAVYLCLIWVVAIVAIAVKWADVHHRNGNLRLVRAAGRISQHRLKNGVTTEPRFAPQHEDAQSTRQHIFNADGDGSGFLHQPGKELVTRGNELYVQQPAFGPQSGFRLALLRPLLTSRSGKAVALSGARRDLPR